MVRKRAVKRRHPLDGVDVSKFDEVRLSEESVALVTRLLTDLKVMAPPVEGAATSSASVASARSLLSGKGAPPAADEADVMPTFNIMDEGGVPSKATTSRREIVENGAVPSEDNVYSLSGRDANSGVEAGARYEEYEEDQSGRAAEEEGDDDESDAGDIMDSIQWAEEQIRLAGGEDVEEKATAVESASQKSSSSDSEEEEDDDEAAVRGTALFLHLTTQLSFTESDAVRACRATKDWGVPAVAADSEKTKDEEKGEKKVASNTDELDGDLLALAMDWLCLHLTEDQLKFGFKPKPKPKGKDKLGLLKRPIKSGALPPGRGAIRMIPHNSISVAPPPTAREWMSMSDNVSRKVGFVRLGFHRSEADEACQLTGPAPSSVSAEDDTDALRALLSILERQVLEKDRNGTGPLDCGEKPNAADLEFALMERDQEVQAMEAIFTEAFEVVGDHGVEKCYKLTIGPMEALKPPGTIEGSKLRIFTRATYPTLSPPLILFTNPTLAPTLLRRINEAMILKASELVGEPSIFAIMDFLIETVPKLHNEFAREQRALEMEAEQLRLRKKAGHDIEKVIEAQSKTEGQIGKKQRARLKAAEKAYDRGDKSAEEAKEKERKREERLKNIKVENKSHQMTLAQRKIVERQQERIQEEAETAARSAMNAAFLRGESADVAREIARKARNENLRSNGVDAPDEDKAKAKASGDGKGSSGVQKKGAPERKDDGRKIPSNGFMDGPSPGEEEGDEDDEDDDSRKHVGATKMTIAFTDRLKQFYAEAKARKEQVRNNTAGGSGERDFSNLHLAPAAEIKAPPSAVRHGHSEEDFKEEQEPEHAPAPIFIPNTALNGVMEDVIKEQSKQPWLIAPEARVPTVQEDPSAVHTKQQLSKEEMRQQEQTSRSLKNELVRKHKAAEDWARNNQGGNKGRSGGGRGSGSIGQQFNKMIAQRSRLPGYKMKKEIVGTIATNQITVISGDTGENSTKRRCF